MTSRCSPLPYHLAEIQQNGGEKEKGLSTGEKKMLLSAKQILISELVLAKNIEHTEVENMINNVLNS